MLLTARAVEARCSQAGRTDFRCSCSLPFLLVSNSFSSCPSNALLGSLCSLCVRRPNLRVQWLGAVSACCDASCRSQRISPHFEEQGRLHVRPHDFSLQVCLASLFACCARQHERPHVCWPVGCLLFPVLRCVLPGFRTSFFVHQHVGATMTDCVFALENAILFSSPRCVPRLCWGTSARVRTCLSCHMFFQGFDVPSVGWYLFTKAIGHVFASTGGLMMPAQPVSTVLISILLAFISFPVGERVQSRACACLSLCSPCSVL